MATKIDKFIAEKTGMDPAEVQAKMQACLKDPSLRDHDFMKAIAEYMIAEGIGQGRDFNQFRMPDEKTLVQMGNRGIQQINNMNEAQHSVENARNDPSVQKKEDTPEDAAPEETVQERLERMRAERAAQREAFKKSRQKPAETKPPETKEPEQPEAPEQKEPETAKNDAPVIDQATIDEMIKVKEDVGIATVGAGAGDRSYSGPTEVKANPESWALINEAGNLMAERFKEAGIDVDPHHFTYLHRTANSEFSQNPMDKAQFQQAEAILQQALIDVGVSEDNTWLFMDTMGVHSYEDAAPQQAANNDVKQDKNAIPQHIIDQVNKGIEDVAPTNDTPVFDDETLKTLKDIQKNVETVRVGDNEPPAGDTSTGKVNYGFVNDGPGIIIGGDTPNPHASEPPAGDNRGGKVNYGFVNDGPGIIIGGDTPNPHASEPPPVEDPTERWAKAKEDFDPSQVHTGLTTDIPSNEGLEQFANSRMDALAAFADKFKNEGSSILLGNKQGSVEMATTVIETASLKTSTTISNMTTSIETTSIEQTASVDMTTSVTMNVQMPS